MKSTISPLKIVRDSKGPYGVKMPNGLNLSRAANNPRSLFTRILSVLSNVGPMPKVSILFALGYPVQSCHSRGYHSNYFSAMVKAGFLTHKRLHGTVLWTWTGKLP